MKAIHSYTPTEQSEREGVAAADLLEHHENFQNMGIPSMVGKRKFQIMPSGRSVGGDLDPI